VVLPGTNLEDAVFDKQLSKTIGVVAIVCIGIFRDHLLDHEPVLLISPVGSGRADRHKQWL
jgi:hypothetical protein